MPNITEIRIIQRRTLHMLLQIKKDLDKKGVTSESLALNINVITSEMDSDDIAAVEKKIRELQ